MASKQTSNSDNDNRKPLEQFGQIFDKVKEQTRGREDDSIFMLGLKVFARLLLILLMILLSPILVIVLIIAFFTAL
jgi:hypothetical protein